MNHKNINKLNAVKFICDQVHSSNDDKSIMFDLIHSIVNHKDPSFSISQLNSMIVDYRMEAGLCT